MATHSSILASKIPRMEEPSRLQSMGSQRVDMTEQLHFTSLHFTSCCCSVAKSCLTLCDPMDCSTPGSSVHGISQQEYWSGLLCRPPGDLPDPGIRPTSIASSAWAGGFFSFESAGKPTLYYARERIICWLCS